jgi:RNA methyltransferase, TrmH family
MISSAANARIKAARKLQRRRQRYAVGQMLLEGLRLVQDAVSAGARPLELFYVPARLEGNLTAAELMRTLEAQGVACLACSEEVFATLAETVSPQGIAAVVALPELALPAAPTLTLILDGVRDPGNAGALLRSAEAAGVALVLFGPETVDPYNDKTLRAGMGAHFRLPLRVCQNWREIDGYLAPGQSLYLAEAGAKLAYDRVNWRETAALVIGGEAEGASPEARERAEPLAIPMEGKVESLNAAVAGAVILFEAARQRRLD